MKRVLILCGLACALALVGCAKKKSAPTVSRPVTPIARVLVKQPFSIPADSALSRSRISLWKTVNGPLDSLTIAYQDSFKTSIPENHLRLQKSFTDAQDQVCLRAGLNSGYEEYTFILSALSLSKNRPLADSLGITVR